MAKASFHIYVYGPESDYEEERLDSKDFKSLKDALAWAKKHIPAPLAYKVYKFQEVANVPPRDPNYLG